MKIKIKNNVALVDSPEVVLADSQSALDFMFTVHHETGCVRMALNKAAVAEDFFRLSSGVAGDVLQRFINYHRKLAIYGDFTGYTSKPLQDFIRESNRGNDVFFAATPQQAVEWLSAAKE